MAGNPCEELSPTGGKKKYIGMGAATVYNIVCMCVSVVLARVEARIFMINNALG